MLDATQMRTKSKLTNHWLNAGEPVDGGVGVLVPQGLRD
jgi:hypothetical protein